MVGKSEEKVERTRTVKDKQVFSLTQMQNLVCAGRVTVSWKSKTVAHPNSCGTLCLFDVRFSNHLHTFFQLPHWVSHRSSFATHTHTPPALLKQNFEQLQDNGNQYIPAIQKSFISERGDGVAFFCWMSCSLAVFGSKDLDGGYCKEHRLSHESHGVVSSAQTSRT